MMKFLVIKNVGHSNTTNVKVKCTTAGVAFIQTLEHSNTTNVKVKFRQTNADANMKNAFKYNQC